MPDWSRVNSEEFIKKLKFEEKIITRKAFDALRESDRDIIRMKSVMEYEDIAKIENKTVNAISTQYARALERFKKNLQNLDQEEYKNEQ